MLSQERASSASLPCVVFVEQPAHTSLFRWGSDPCGCESQISSRDPRRADCPSILIHNFQGPVLLTISLVTSQEPHYPHPYLLQGGRGYKMSKGICYFRTRAEGRPIELRNLRIKKLAADSLRASLLDKRSLCYDPFHTNYEHLDVQALSQPIDLTSARLCVTAYLEQEGRFDYCLLPAISEPIRDSREKSDLTIVWLSHVAGPSAGHQICCLLAGRVERDDVEVHFYDDANDWQGFGCLYPPGVYENTAIVFSTPAYRREKLEQPVTVSVRLRLKSDPSVTSPRVYRYTYQSSYSDERDCLFNNNKRPKIAPQDLVARTLAATNGGGANAQQHHQRKNDKSDELLKLQMQHIFDKNLEALDSPSTTAHSVASSGGSAAESRNEHHHHDHHRVNYLDSIYACKKTIKQEKQTLSTTSIGNGSCISDADEQERKYSEVTYEFDPLLRN